MKTLWAIGFVTLFFASLAGAQAQVVESALVGLWQELAQGAPRFYYQIDPDGKCVRYVRTASGLQSEAGKFEAAKNRWTISTPSGGSDGGTYTVRGPNLVALTGKRGIILWKRTGMEALQGPSRPQPRPRENWREVPGIVKSASAEQLVLVTDRDMSVWLPKGTEMTFLVNRETKILSGSQSVAATVIQPGDAVTVRYEEERSQRIAKVVWWRSAEGLTMVRQWCQASRQGDRVARENLERRSKARGMAPWFPGGREIPVYYKEVTVYDMIDIFNPGQVIVYLYLEIDVPNPAGSEPFKVQVPLRPLTNEEIRAASSPDGMLYIEKLPRYRSDPVVEWARPLTEGEQRTFLEMDQSALAICYPPYVVVVPDLKQQAGETKETLRASLERFYEQSLIGRVPR